MEKKETHTPIPQSTVKYVGVPVTLDFHELIMRQAEAEGISASRLYKKALVQYLTRPKK